MRDKSGEKGAKRPRLAPVAPNDAISIFVDSFLCSANQLLINVQLSLALTQSLRSPAAGHAGIRIESDTKNDAFIVLITSC